MSNIQSATGAITSIVGLGFTLGALGLTLEFVDRAFSRATPQQPQTRRGRQTQQKRKPLFETGASYNDIFNPIANSKGKSSYSNFFGGY